MATKFSENLSIEQIQEILISIQSTAFKATHENALSSPSNKGIYFWYISLEGISILSKYLDSSFKIEDPLTIINGKILIYLGTAGTRLTENNLGHIKQRLLWHIATKHRPSAVINGTISTLRTTLGALLSDDLILAENTSTEKLINDFMLNHLSFSFIEYKGNSDDIIDSINKDELILIKSIKPLLNLKNNPNAKLKLHPTHIIQKRRQLINKSSKLRLQ